MKTISRPSLAAREPLLRALFRAVDRVADGELVVASVVGPAGSGKSAVLAELGLRLGAAGVETRFAQAFRGDRSRPGSVAEVLRGDGLPSDGPVAILIDDAQWADATTLGWIHVVLGSREDGVLVALATSEEASLHVETLADAGGRRGSHIPVSLAHLTAMDIVPLLSGTETERADFAIALIERSHGVAEELDALVERAVANGAMHYNNDGLVLDGVLPASRELAFPSDLSSTERLLAEAVMLASRPLSLSEIRILLDGTGEDALEAAESVARVGLVRETERGLAPPDDDAVVRRLAEDLGDMRRGALFSALAQAAEQAGGDSVDRGLVGYYYLKAGEFAKAFPLLAETALGLAGRQHFGEALPLAEHALAAYEAADVDDPELEGRLLLARAEAFEYAGWPDAAAADLDVAARRLGGRDRIRALGYAAAIADARQLPQQAEGYLAAAMYEAVTLGEQAMEGSLRTLLARILQRLGFAAEADAALAAGLAALEAHGDEAQRFRGRYNSAWVAFDRGEWKNAAPLFEDCVERAPDLGGSGFAADVEAWLGRARFGMGMPDEALAAVEAAVTHADLDGSTAPVFLSHMAVAEGASMYGSYEQALRSADLMLGVVIRQLPAWENAARYLRAQALWRLGRPDDAAVEASRATDASPGGVDGERWRDKLRVLEMRIDAERGSSPWPVEEASILLDRLLGARRYASATALMIGAAVHDGDVELAAQGAALAMRSGDPMAAAEAVHAGRLWDAPESGVVVSAVKRLRDHVPPDWREAWESLEWVAPALEIEVVPDEAYQASVEALERRWEQVLEQAGMSDVATVLSPAQRRARGLRRRRPRARRRRLVAAAAAFVAALTTVAVITLTGGTPIEENELEHLDPLVVASQWGHLASSAGGAPRAGLGVPGEASGFYWKFQTGGPIRSSPVLYGKTLIFGSDDGFVYAVDAASGRRVWSFETQGPVRGSVTVAGVRVTGQAPSSAEEPAIAFFAGSDGVLYERDPVLASASQRLRVEVGPTVGSPVVIPAADGAIGGTAFIGSRDGAVYAIDVETGETRWVRQTGAEIVGSPALGDGHLWVGNIDGDLVKINPSDGSIPCTVRTMGPIDTTPLVYDGLVYVGTASGGIWPYRSVNCTLTMSAPSFVTEAPVDMTPVIVEGIAYSGEKDGFGRVMIFAEDRFVRAVDPKTGEDIWQFRTEAPVRSSPAVAEGVVYIGDESGVVYALDAGTKEELWRFRTGGAITAAIALAPGVVFVASHDGVMYAIGNGRVPEPTDVPVESAPFVAAKPTSDPKDDAPRPGEEAVPAPDQSAEGPPPAPEPEITEDSDVAGSQADDASETGETISPQGRLAGAG